MTIPKMQRPPAVNTPQLAPMPTWAIGSIALLTAVNAAWRATRLRPAAAGSPSLERAPSVSPLPEDKPVDTLPAEIPERGWKEILWRVYDGVTEARILLIAAGVTFYLILGLFPGIAVLVSVYGLFVDPQTMVNHLDIVTGVAPGGATDVLREQLTRLGQQTSTTLGVSFLVSLAISVWTATSGIRAVFDGLNVAYGETEKRSFVRLTAIALLFTVGAIVFVLVALAAVVALPVALSYIPLPGLTSVVLNIARWPILFVIVTFALSIFYRYGPSHAAPKWRWISWGSVSATILWLAASILFSWYVAYFGSYNKTYGSLGAIIGFMTWIWLSVIAVLLGGQLNAEIERQTGPR
jgi:membrane protein